MQKIPITVVVPVLNEALNLGRCLAELGDFEEVVVVDSGSVDETREIARGFNATIISFQWDGKFPKKRNWTLRNHEFRTDWVLFLDADEQITGEVRQELRRIVPGTRHAGFWLNYNNVFMGRRLRFGVPQKKLALFRRDAGEYERIEEESWSKLDMEIHEHPQISGSTGILKNRVVHRDFKSIAHFIDRHNEYSSWEARRYLKIREITSQPLSLTSRQKIKYRLLSMQIFGYIYFILTYVVYLGFLDGRNGLDYATLKAGYFYQVYLKIRELKLGNELLKLAPVRLPRVEPGSGK